MDQSKFSEVVSRYTEIRFDCVDKRYYGSCPFCHAKTDTFFADNQEDIFFCYICGTGGNRIDFDNLINHKILADNKKDATLLSIYKNAAQYYHQNLLSGKNDGQEYLRKRRINAEIAKKFGLGFAPDSFSLLYKCLKGSYTDEDLIRSGLIRLSQNGYPYDFFRNRIMFPIFDGNGNVIAFGGRVLGREIPKYINSAESDIFSKRKNLYGFPYDAGYQESIIICEGYMDCIAIKNAEYPDCAATLGTALTKEHANFIASQYKHVYLALDSDAAGIVAIKRSIEILVSVGLTVSVPNFIPAKDPDEMIRDYGCAEFERCLKDSISSDEFIARHAKDVNEILEILLKQV